MPFLHVLLYYALTASHPHAHARCGWIEIADETGIQTFTAHASWFAAIHPVWYKVTADGDGVAEQKGAGDPRVVKAARAAGVRLMPTVASVNRKVDVRRYYLDPATRAAHVAALVRVVVDRGWDGLDVDYEKLPDGDRAAFTAFVEALAGALHAKQKLVSITVRATPADVGPYDYVRIARAADWVHVMTYDYHWLGGSHPGPVSPEGWVEAVARRIEATGLGGKFILGVPNYGITMRSSCRLAECPARCAGPVDTRDVEMAVCENNEQRFAAGRTPHCPTADGIQFFDDLASIEAKRAIARRHGLGGITYWSLGGEPDGWFTSNLGAGK